jgi:hypothetical protein
MWGNRVGRANSNGGIPLKRPEQKGDSRQDPPEPRILSERMPSVKDSVGPRLAHAPILGITSPVNQLCSQVHILPSEPISIGDKASRCSHRRWRLVAL